MKESHAIEINRKSLIIFFHNQKRTNSLILHHRLVLTPMISFVWVTYSNVHKAIKARKAEMIKEDRQDRRYTQNC